MPWLNAASAPKERPNQRRGYRQAVDVAVALDVAGLRLPANATIIDISVGGCRLRSWILLERGADVSFLWPRDSGGLQLRGRIVVRRAAPRGATFEYGVEFAGLSRAAEAELAREITQAQRRAAAARAQEAAGVGVSTDAFNRRHAYRARTEFPVSMRLDDRAGIVHATATDISGGGLRIVCDDVLADAQELMLRFRLPSDVLRVYPEKVDEELVMTPFGPRRRSHNRRRPFEETQLRSRIQTRLADWHGRPAYGVAFIEIDGYTREEIARFIHAVQLGRLRQKSR